MPPLRLYYFFDPILQELVKYTNTPELSPRNAPGTPKSIHRTRQFLKYNNNNNNNKPIGKAQGWPGGPGAFMDLKHQKPAEKACVPYAPLTFIILV